MRIRGFLLVQAHARHAKQPKAIVCSRVRLTLAPNTETTHGAAGGTKGRSSSSSASGLSVVGGHPDGSQPTALTGRRDWAEARQMVRPGGYRGWLELESFASHGCRNGRLGKEGIIRKVSCRIVVQTFVCFVQRGTFRGRLLHSAFPRHNASRSV